MSELVLAPVAAPGFPSCKKAAEVIQILQLPDGLSKLKSYAIASFGGARLKILRRLEIASLSMRN